MAYDFFQNMRRRRLTGVNSSDQTGGMFQQQGRMPLDMMGSEEPIESPEVELPQQRTAFMQKFLAGLQSQPERGDYKASVLRKILAGVAGGAQGIVSGNPMQAYDATKGIIDEPYERARSDWKNDMSSLGQGAEMEESFNTANLKRYLDAENLKRQTEDSESQRELRRAQVGNYGRLAAQSSPEAKEADRLRGLQSQMDYWKFQGDNPHPDRRIFNNELNGSSSVIDVNDPAYKVDLGRTNQTPTEKANLDVNVHGQKNDLDVAEHEKTSAIDTKAHEAERKIDVANPIPRAPNPLAPEPGLSATQNEAALRGAARQVVLDFPGYSKFVDDKGNIKPPSGMWADPKGFEDFSKKLKTEKEKIIKQSRRGTPLSPNLPVVDEKTTRAVAELKAIGIENPNAAQIAEAIKDLENQ